MTLHIEQRGKGRALVLFHGWGFDNQIWLDLAKTLEGRYTLYLVDLPGFGQSSLMDWELFKQNLLMRLPEVFALSGWSMGGLLAMRLAVEEAKRVSHLISIASSPRFIKEEFWPGVEKVVLDNFFLNLTKDPQATVSQFVSLQLANQPQRYHNQQFPQPESLKAGLDILASWDLREPLRNFTKPTCFMFGRLDAITPRTTMETMQKIYPNFDFFMFKKAAHMPFLSHQEEFINKLEAVLA